MPGLTACLMRDLNLARFHTAQQTMLYQSDDRCVLHHANGPVGLGTVCSSSYPLLILQAPHGQVIQAGRIYNKTPDQIRRELTDIARRVHTSGAMPSDAIRRWMLEADGEYSVAIALPGRLIVFTDPLGRLPLYYYADADQLIVARECKFIMSLVPIRYDPIGCAQSLWFLYPLGERTLFRDVKTMPAGALLEGRVMANGSLLTTCRSLTTMNLEEKERAQRRVGVVADELCEQFVEACRTHGSHPDAGANIVGLSGGHDSRAVLAGMVKAGVSCQAFTGVAHGRQLKHEVSSAKAVAQALRVMQWTYETPLADMAMNRELVRIKDGLTTVANAFNIADLRLLRDRFGFSATYVTGDGGDKALPDLRLPHRSRSLPALAREIGRSYGSHGLPAETAARLTGVPIDDLYDDLERLLASYPEQDLEQKGVHFALYERGRRFVFEGEDRKRFFFAWQTSPFLSHPFLSACMRVPDRAKTDRRLYRRFLAMLSPETAAIPLTNVGVGASDPTYLARTWLRRRYDTLPWSVRDRIKRRLKKAARPVETAPEVAATIQTALAKRDGLGAIVDQDLLRKLGPRGARHILTLALTVEALPVSSSTEKTA